MRIAFLTSGVEAEAEGDATLLRLSIRHRGGIPFKCAGGVCGTCRCRVEQGREALSPPTAQERRLLEEGELAAGWRLACQARPEGDLAVSWEPAG